MKQYLLQYHVLNNDAEICGILTALSSKKD